MKFQVQLLFYFSILLSSCASIFSKSRYPIRISSAPIDAKVNIYNRKGIQVFSGVTPCIVLLKSKSGYLHRAIYTVEFYKEGFRKKTFVITSRVNEWYYGNILFGGLAGMLVIDPITGAMYKIKTVEINEELNPER